MNKKIVVSTIICSLALVMFSALMASSVRADTTDAKITSYSWYVADTNSVLAYPGDLVVVGEVQNIGTSNLAVVDIGAAAYNSSGDFLASSQNNAFVFNLMPGQKAPFYVDLSAESSVTGDLSWVPLATNITAAVINAPDTTTSLYQGVTITSNSHSIDANGLYTVSGTVTNTGSQTSGPLWVVASFYNSSGTVITVDFSNEIAETLAPGASAPFTVVPIDNNVAASSQIANYSLLVQSQDLSATQMPSPTPVATSTPPPVSTATLEPTVTTPHATATGIAGTTVLIAALVAIVAVLVIAIALLLLRKNRKPASTPQPIESPSPPTESPPQTPP